MTNHCHGAEDEQKDLIFEYQDNSQERPQPLASPQTLGHLDTSQSNPVLPKIDSQSQLNSDLQILNDVSNIEPELHEDRSLSDPSLQDGDDNRILGNADFDDADFQALK